MSRATIFFSPFEGILEHAIVGAFGGCRFFDGPYAKARLTELFVLDMHEEEGIHIALKAEELWSVLGIPITNTMLMSWLAMAVLIAVALMVGPKLTKIPGKLQTFFELVFSYILDFMSEILESRQLAFRFFPIIVTLFMFILVGNWFGLMPGIGSIGLAKEDHGEVHYVEMFHPVSTDLNITLALAIIAFAVIEVSGVLYLGFLKYAGKFVNLRSPTGFFVGLIEIVTEFARIISFSFRLFGNMFAGKMLILVAMFFVPLILPIPLMMYEVFVGFIQAAIFALLTLFFVKMAVSEPH